MTKKNKFECGSYVTDKKLFIIVKSSTKGVMLQPRTMAEYILNDHGDQWKLTYTQCQ